MGLPVFARFARDGAHLYGRYFYGRAGIDIPLDGTISEGGSVRLTEGAAAAQTGRFEGTCEPSSGALAGTWTGDRTAGAFRLVPVPPGERAVAATKRFSVSRPVRKPDPETHVRVCAYAESRVELFGLRDEAIEHAVNHQSLEPRMGAAIDASLAKSVEKCGIGFGFEAEETQTLASSFRELATLETSGWIDGDGMHPNELGFARVTIDLRTGKPVQARDVFERDPMDRVVACAAKTTPLDEHLDEDEWRTHMDESRFDLAEDGVHFFGSDFPHVMAALSGLGPTIGYDVLLRDGYLRPDSPVKRAWRGVQAAPKGRPWCPLNANLNRVSPANSTNADPGL